MTERNSRLLIALRLIQIVLNKRERESDYVFLGGNKLCFGSSGFLKDPAAVAIVIANPVPVDLVSGFPNYKLHKTNEPYGTHFPIISIFDMVRAQFKLLDHLGISKLFVSVGSNMGGMQSIVTAWLEPQRVQRVKELLNPFLPQPSTSPKKTFKPGEPQHRTSVITLSPMRVGQQEEIVEVLAKEEEEDDDASVGVGDNGDDNLPGQQQRCRRVRSGMSDKSISVSTKY
ncbi:hypothetical protein PPACK8108_LOCUS16963 [Phakopsora pachyrhizi]|uniref:Uncharacterized protein n=1 Tax=Phakopsora pachyrhizi TaxID=170000 RepID=A0AAV0B8X0_PHAPC|nr:hypothetical protein PPACK8108_LOCUS16963 [Phakopsora pachyrhizi]